MSEPDDDDPRTDDEPIERPERRTRPRRRHTDRNLGPIPVDVQSLPAWLRAAVFLGVPSVIALFLVWALTTQMAGKVAAMETNQALQQQTIEGINKALSAQAATALDTREHFDDGLRRVMAMIRYTCVAAAETDAQQRDCLRERERRAPEE